MSPRHGRFCFNFSLQCPALRPLRLTSGSQLAPNATRHCPLINEEYHYNALGYKILADAASSAFRSLLGNSTARKITTRRASVARDTATAMRHTETSDNGATESLAANPVASTFQGSLCGDGLTVCPAGSTRVADTFSGTKWGCRMVELGVDCGDSWHCCIHGQKCVANGTNPSTPGQPPRPGPYSHICRDS